jgi:hypothetical protein
MTTDPPIFDGQDLKHVGLIFSAGIAVALRFFSDFGFTTIQQNARDAGLDLSRASPAALAVLTKNSLVDELQRDWFNLSPQAPLQVIVVVGAVVAAYVLLRRALAPEPAVAVVLLAIPFLPLVATFGACAWVLLRAARGA